jgi:hypothetical protein
MGIRSWFILLAALLLTAPVRAQSDAADAPFDSAEEQRILEEVIDIGWKGGLGFDWPDGWAYFYNPQYGACGKIGNNPCVPVSSDTPIEENGDRMRSVWALTDRQGNHTTFFRNSASPKPAGAISYADPTTGLGEGVVAYSKGYTAREMAAYVIGHEVRGHLVEHLDGMSRGEMLANYYGMQAVKALRIYDKKQKK